MKDVKEKDVTESDEKQDELKLAAGKKEVVISDCPVHSVVVYPDRAEVCFVVKYSVLHLYQLCQYNYIKH